MSKSKINLLDYCHGCLANDRPLISIDGLLHIFLKIMENEVDKIGWKVTVPKMCWECRAVLRNSEKFLMKAVRAQEYLAKYASRKVRIQSLSTLSTVTINSYNVHEIHEDYEPETNLGSNEISYELEIELKQENSLSNEKFDIDLKEENVSSNEKFKVDLKEEVLSSDERVADDCEDMKDNVENEIKVEIEIKRESKVESDDKKRDVTNDEKNDKKATNAKFKVLTLADDGVNISKAYKTVTIDEKERLHWKEVEKTARNYSTMAYKCELCISGHPNKEVYDKHIAKFHLESSGKFECDICKKRYKTKKRVTDHIREHFMKYVCLMCGFENRRSFVLKTHLMSHKRVFMCLTCGLKFGSLHKFYEHNRRLHARVICDYCGMKWTKKRFLIRHIKLRHCEHRCEICNRSYSSLDALTSHSNLHHVLARTEDSYCVECNVQFDNVARYTVHLKTSVKHKKYKGVPCPVCNKVYRKKYSMTNHYKYEHLKETPHRCDICSKYFLNSYRLRRHNEGIHNKIPQPKNKICPHCGRGFTTNCILNNHIRTHTGERPFECDMCSSTFAQKTALVTHKRSIHKTK